MKKKLFGIDVFPSGEKEILEHILKYVKTGGNFFHIISLNPEIVMHAVHNEKMKEIVEKSDAQIIDGFGIVAASKMLNLHFPSRISGVDLMERLLSISSEESLRVMLIGGKKNLANRIAHCYIDRTGNSFIKGMEGIQDIKNPKKEEEEKIFSIVADFKPHIIFVAFGSPYQEMWLWKNRDKLKNSVGMGVGGAFDFLGGDIPRAPRIVRQIGLEWFFRLLVQPWRGKRQLRLIAFTRLLLKEYLRSIVSKWIIIS